MRILYVINSLLSGGAEAVVTEWATQLQRLGHQVDVCTIYCKGQFALQLERQGIKVYDLALDPGLASYKLRRKYDLRVVLPLARLAQGGNYQIVHAHLFPSSLFVALASFFYRGTSYIFSEHNVFNRRRRSPIFKLIDRGIYHRYVQIVAVSDEVRHALLRWLPGLEAKTQTVPNAVNPARFNVSIDQVQQLRRELGLSEQDKVVLFAGRMQPAKGVDVLIEALARLSPQDLSLRVLLAGGGPLQETLQEQAAAAGLADRVTFLGIRTDIPLLLNLADLLVLPSRWEGLPIILLEAMAARTPVLATAVGGVPGVIEHGVSGWLVPPEDPPALAQGITSLLQSAELRDRLSGEAFKKLCAHHSTEVTMQKLLDIYDKALQVRG